MRVMYYQEAHNQASFNENRSYQLDLNKLQKPYLEAYMSQIYLSSLREVEHVFNKDHLFKS